jgi:nitrogen regulatory protein PII
MKKIEAIILPANVEAVREGLKAAGVLARLVVTPVCGLQRSSVLSNRDAEPNHGFIRALKVEVIVSDQLVRKAANAIFDYSCFVKEGIGIGQITVLNVETTLPIGPD